jgi:hypothetical protein
MIKWKERLKISPVFIPQNLWIGGTWDKSSIKIMFLSLGVIIHIHRVKPVVRSDGGEACFCTTCGKYFGLD